MNFQRSMNKLWHLVDAKDMSRRVIQRRRRPPRTWRNMVASTEGEPSWVVSNLPTTKGGDQFKVMYVVFCEKINNILFCWVGNRPIEVGKTSTLKKKESGLKSLVQKVRSSSRIMCLTNKESQPAYNDIINITEGNRLWHNYFTC